MTTFSNVKGVLFDLNGIITDSWLYHSKSWRQVAESIGVQWSDQLEEAIKGRDRIDSLNAILSAGGLEDAYSDQQKEALADKKNAIYQQMLEVMNPNDNRVSICQRAKGNSKIRTGRLFSIDCRLKSN